MLNFAGNTIELRTELRIIGSHLSATEFKGGIPSMTKVQCRHPESHVLASCTSSMSLAEIIKPGGRREMVLRLRCPAFVALHMLLKTLKPPKLFCIKVCQIGSIIFHNRYICERRRSGSRVLACKGSVKLGCDGF